jgi:hypothetical protein
MWLKKPAEGPVCAQPVRRVKEVAEEAADQKGGHEGIVGAKMRTAESLGNVDHPIGEGEAEQPNGRNESGKDAEYDPFRKRTPRHPTGSRTASVGILLLP